MRRPAKSVFFPYREAKLTKMMKAVCTGMSDVTILGHLKYFAKEEDNAKALDFLSKGRRDQSSRSRTATPSRRS